MDDMEFCSCCRVHHRRSDMRRVDTRQGVRWRCVRSLEAARRSETERDAFGRRQSEQNRMASQQAAWYSRIQREANRRLA